MKMWGSKHVAVLSLTSLLERCEWPTSSSDRFTLVEEPLVSIKLEAGWAPEPVWTLWKIEKPLAPAGYRNKILLPSSSYLVTTATALFGGD
jgi:hypothetical protein